MNILIDSFSFSQSNLQDFLDCPRRFELRHIEKIRCPALRSEPYDEMDRRIEMGQLFHRLVHQVQIGIPQEDILTAFEPQLKLWMDNYTKSSLLQNLPSQKFVEYTLQSRLSGYRVVAKFDLLAVDAGNEIVIIDWKTQAKQSTPAILKRKVQSRLYPCMIVLAGAFLNDGNAVIPEMVRMIYWFPNFPDQPITFSYNGAQFENDQSWLEMLIDDISHRKAGEFQKTEDTRLCLYCEYRSLCNRGTLAGNLDDNLNADDFLEENPFWLDIQEVDETPF